jgi:hypothetical protein
MLMPFIGLPAGCYGSVQHAVIEGKIPESMAVTVFSQVPFTRVGKCINTCTYRWTGKKATSGYFMQGSGIHVHLVYPRFKVKPVSNECIPLALPFTLC